MGVEVIPKRGPKSGANVRPEDERKIVAPLGDPPGPLGVHGQVMWDSVTGEAKWLAVSDSTALYTVCLSYQRYVEMDERYWVHLDALGSEPPSDLTLKLLKELNVVSDRVFKQLAEMGLTPNARRNQGLAEVKLRSKMDEFMEKQRSAQQKKRYARPNGNADVKKAKARGSVA